MPVWWSNLVFLIKNLSNKNVINRIKYGLEGTAVGGGFPLVGKATQLGYKYGLSPLLSNRFGVGADFGAGRQVDYVLGEWSVEEREKLKERLEKSAALIESFVLAGLARTMNQFNNK